METNKVGALVAAVEKEGSDLSAAVLLMLETLSHRGSKAFGIASPHRVVIKKTVEELRREVLNSNILIGHNFDKNLPRDKAQPIKSRDFTVVFEGRLFTTPVRNEADQVVEQLVEVDNSPISLIQRLNGAYSFAIARDSEILVGRDPTGTYPLYFGENEHICAVASERKALWKIGIMKTRSFPPGKLSFVKNEGFSFKTAKTITQPPLQKLDMITAARKLKHMLFESTRKHVLDVEEVAVAFSGGVDSSIIAFLAKLCDIDVHLVYVALEGQSETLFAERAARALELPLNVAIYSIHDLEETLPKALWLIENPNPVNAGIATAIFWVAEQSARLGLRVLLAGQGGDELFGGYHRYVKEYSEHGLSGLQRRLYRDIVSSHESNFQRDNKVCAFHNVELRMPFVEWDVIQLALSFPPSLKVASPKDALRKRVLRLTAKEFGIPKFVAEKTKKAIQYTTGVNQAMKKLASEKGHTLRKYVEHVFLKETCARLGWEEWLKPP